MRWLYGLFALAGLWSCGGELAPTAPFAERTAQVGIDFVHRNGMSGELYFSEMVGSGIALLDFDLDGDLDLYAVQGGPLGPLQGSEPASDRLFRNELVPSGTLRFTDVTSQAGIEGYAYGMGVAVGDVDGDRFPDVYVSGFGGGHLWLNQRDGTFVDVLTDSGAQEDRWTTAAAFLDVDQDGRLDLWTVAYTDFRLETHQPCRSPEGGPDYCGPRTYRPEADRLWLNRSVEGSVRFLELSDRVGLAARPGAGLGIGVLDADGDGRSDVFVANDQEVNHLWMNRGLDAEGLPLLSEEGLDRGVAVDALGRPEASMGVAVGDADADGHEDLLITHLKSETNTLYLNDGTGYFHDATLGSGLGAPSVPMTGFGTDFLDVDNDGWLDLVAVNGEVRLISAQQAAGVELALQQPNQLFRNRGGRFEEWSEAGELFGRLEVSRGLAVGDLDNDGDADLVVSHNNAPLDLLLNQVGSRSDWLGLHLLDAEGRVALGAEVRLYREGQPVLLRRVRRAGSYLSSRDPRLLFGLGTAARIDRIEVRWPDGSTERLEPPALGSYHQVRQQVEGGER